MNVKVMGVATAPSDFAGRQRAPRMIVAESSADGISEPSSPVSPREAVVEDAEKPTHTAAQ